MGSVGDLEVAILQMENYPSNSEVGAPSRKKQKTNHSESIDCQEEESRPREVHLSEPSFMGESFDSSFNFGPSPPRSQASASVTAPIDINKYIPVGCLRLHVSPISSVSSDIWRSCTSWAAFSHPLDIYNPSSGSYLPSTLEDRLFGSKVLQDLVTLHNSSWIRMEFKAKDSSCGQVRVYILPADVANTKVDRRQSNLRKAMQSLLTRLDLSKATWNSEWSEDTPITHIIPSLHQNDEDEVSLFYLFNNLPSPNPNPDLIIDPYAQEAMYQILDSDIPGVITEMHPYQRRTAAMMLQRETQPTQDLDPRLLKLTDQKGSVWYCDIDGGLCFREPRTYEAARGGICAETMGLGKTLICLALILATRDISSQIPPEYSLDLIPVRSKTGSLMKMAAATIGRNGLPWKKNLAYFESQGIDFVNCREALLEEAGHYFIPAPPPRRVSRGGLKTQRRKIWLSAATIVVVPANLVQQWQSEIQKHCTGLRVLVMSDAASKLPAAKELSEYDLILFSKMRFDREAKEEASEDLPAKSKTMAVRQRVSNQEVDGIQSGISRDTDESTWAVRHSGWKPETSKLQYHSPLKDVHFKRLIVDEGHNFGNSSASSRTEALTVVDFLQLTSRWIVSGTPTQGLYGTEVAIDQPGLGTENMNNSAHLTSTLPSTDLRNLKTVGEARQLFYKQERKDLEKLGNIATSFLKARPWCNAYQENDPVSWSQLVMQPRHGSKSRGNMDCLKATLEGMIIRHRPEDVAVDITLPPLYQKTVYLEGSIQNKLSLNTFNMMIVTNAVTSERKDADYFFHPRQRKNLMQLVSNLRQASFFWSGFEKDHIQSTVGNAKRFLEKGEVPTTPQDMNLLLQAIEIGETVLSDKMSQAISEFHEMPMYIRNNWPESVRESWSLLRDSTDPMPIGTTMLHAAQNYVRDQISKTLPEDPLNGMSGAGIRFWNNSILNQDSGETIIRKNKSAPTLAGGVTVGEQSTPRKLNKTASNSKLQSTEDGDRELLDIEYFHAHQQRGNVVMDALEHLETNRVDNLAAVDQLKHQAEMARLKPKAVFKLNASSPLAPTTIISTASAKLSYLMDQVITYNKTEKILIFYEADNTAYYIAQSLECLGIEHLIYAKTLSSARRSQYVVTFNRAETFRVLLMDVSQAAFGLDISSASRVYFVNPVFSPQVEAQAVKRAHRIGQTKPVYVETLVLKGSIEEVLLERRKDMSNEEHNKCKNILDDQKLYNWIRNVRFLDLPKDLGKGEDQMSKLEKPQAVFDVDVSA